MGSLFASKQKTNSSGTTDTQTQNNLWSDPGLQNFLSGFNQQYSGPNINTVNPGVNAYQTGAADNQQGVATNPALMQGFGTAANIAQNGFAPQMAAFQNPFENQVVGNMQSDFARQNAEQMDAIRGGAAKSGALGNNTGQGALLMRGAQDAQAKAIGNTRMQGFNTAADLASRNATTQLAGANTAGSLTGANTAANVGLGGLGRDIWQSSLTGNMTPFQLYNQGLQGYNMAGNLAGTNTQGQTTGQQTTTSTPSLGHSLMGIAGLGMNMFGSGGMFPNLFSGGGGNYGGMPYSGGGTSSWRDGGSVKGYNDGGSVMPSFHAGSSFADKVAQAHETVKKMRASGGRTEKPADKGMPSRFAERRIMGDPWAATVTEEREQDPFMNPAQAQRMMAFQPMRPMQYDLAELRGFSAGGTPTPNPQFMNAFETVGNRNPEWPADPMGTAQLFNGFVDGVNTPPPAAMQPFGQFRSQPVETDEMAEVMMPGSAPMTPFGDPNTANFLEAFNPSGPPRLPPFNPNAPAPEAGPVMDPNATVSSGGRGDRRIEAMHPHQRFAAMLMAGSGPQVLGGAGKALLDMHSQRIQEHGAELQADQLAQQLAQQNIENQHRRDVLAETIQHNRNTEANRNQNKPETAFDVANAQAAAKAAQEREGAISASQDQVRRLDQMSTLLSNPNMPQGRFADWEVEGRRIASALLPGVTLDGVPEAEAFRVLSNKMALDMRSTAEGAGMPGAMSDADRVFLLQTVPRLQNTPAGNRLIVNSMRDTAQYRAAVNTEAARFIRNRRSNEGLSEYMDEWMQRNPMERVVPRHAETRREAARVAEQNTPPPPNQAQTPSFGGYTREQLAAMPEGPVLTPQGQSTGFIRRGNELVPVQGAVGTQGNPHPRLADATQPGQYAYDKGKLYRRTNNMLTNRWEEVTQ